LLHSEHYFCSIFELLEGEAVECIRMKVHFTAAFLKDEPVPFVGKSLQITPR
jgi:hypothetical protein